MKSVWLFSVLQVFARLSQASFLDDVTDDVFDDRSKDLIAAYGDFDSDKQTDVFVIGNNGRSIGIYLQEQEEFKFKSLLTLNETSRITSIVPGDFDNDVQMDLLVTLSNDEDADNHKVSCRVYWGQGSKGIKSAYSNVSNDLFLDQPLVFDSNGDMVPDILVETQTGSRLVYTAVDNGDTFKLYNVTWDGEPSKFRFPHSNAFQDLNDDSQADILLTVGDETTGKFERHISIDGTFKKQSDIELPSKSLKVVGQAAFLDFKRESKTCMLLPVCVDAECSSSAIYMTYTNHHDQWELVIDSFKHDDKEYSFIPPKANLAWSDLGQVIPITLHVADINMDGYPDVLTVMRHTQSDGTFVQKAVLMFNEDCGGCKTGRELVPQWDTKLNSLSDVLLASFFDIHEDGILDILAVRMTDEGPAIKAYLNELEADACFLKITVVSGMCNTECKEGREPYGVNQPGPTIKYKTQHKIGEYKESSASQLTQSAHFSLQLPYTVFGLGQTPNFVDHLTVGIPTPKGEKKREEDWTQLIPNSQLIVIPYPHSKPNSWTLKLFLTPSKLIYITGFSLLGTCGVCALIVIVLHLLEKREDRVEKQQESQKFHFDAM